jgi:CelD/BcsL family acetyltransferase involved in cellulose biosynthesis
MFIARQIDSWIDILDRMSLWHILHNRLAPDNPYVSPQWSEIWFNTQVDQKRRKVFLLTATDKGAEGIILLTGGITHRFKLPVKSIESIGVGKSATDRHFVSMQEPLLTQNAIDPLLENIKTFKDWTFFRLAPLPADYPFYQEFITSAGKHGMTTLRRPYSVGYKIRTDMGWEEYGRSRSKNFRKMMRAAQNKMQRSGLFRIEAHKDADLSGKLLDILKTITMKSWKVEAGSDLFNPAYHGFWKMAFAKTIATGQTTLWVLYYKDHPVGYQWCFQQGSRILALKSDYDKEYFDYSPGNLLAWHILKQHFENGVSEIDYCMGGGDYKKKWATDSYELDELLIFNQTLSSRIWHGILARQDQIKTCYEIIKGIMCCFNYKGDHK